MSQLKRVMTMSRYTGAPQLEALLSNLQFILLLPDFLPPLFAQLDEMKHLVFEDLQGWISVDGKELEQYGVHLDEGKRGVTCWIPSEVGKVHPYICLGLHSSDYDSRNSSSI